MTDLLTIPETDIEEELTDENHAHAFAMCPKHKDLRPVTGQIVESLCKKLVRINWESNLPKCPKCSELWNIPGSGFCWVCGVKA